MATALICVFEKVSRISAAPLGPTTGLRFDFVWVNQTWTDPDIISTIPHCVLRVLNCVARYPNDASFRKKLASDRNRHIRLAKMNSVGLDCQCNIHPVVDQDMNVVSMAYILCLLREFDKLERSSLDQSGKTSCRKL